MSPKALSQSQRCWDHTTQLRDPLEALPAPIPALDPDPHRESTLEQSLHRHHRGSNSGNIFLCMFFLLSTSRFYPFVSLSRFSPLVSLHSRKGSSLFLCINKYILYR
ncbi:hypothetical protein Nmel_005040, partial [Mimus melanotis]